MVVESGHIPYQYLDLPFTFIGRRAGVGSGNPKNVEWTNEIVPLPEISGFLYEQCMYTHLAELRKYGDFGFDNFSWDVYVSATASGVIIDIDVQDPDPSGANVSPSGNPYCLNFVGDLRNSLDLIFGLVEKDTDYDKDTIFRDYFQTSFSGTPSGQAGDYQYRLPTNVLFFGNVFGNNPVSASGVVAGSGFMDTRTMTEIHYQPYARLSRRGTHTVDSIEYDTAPLFPAAVQSDGSYPTTSAVESLYRPGQYSTLGFPQTSGYNPAVLASGVWRVIGDVLTNASKLFFVSEGTNPAIAIASDRRWIGDHVWRNRKIPANSGGITDTPGIAYFSSTSSSLPHGVHKVLVSTSGSGWGKESGLISSSPPDNTYDTSGFADGVIGENISNGGGALVRNKTGGIPSPGNNTSAALSGQVPVRLPGVHICDKAFGNGGQSGMIIISPFNGASLLQNTVEDINFGDDGQQVNAYFSKVGPPTWVWRQIYNPGDAFFSDAGVFIRQPGATVAFAFAGQDWTFRSYSYSNFVGPVQPTGAPQAPGSINSTAGLGQTDRLQFLKFNFGDRSVEETGVGYTHSSANARFDATGIAYSRNFGWFGTGSKSSNNHRFESFTVNGTPDGGSLVPSNAGGLELVQPIGIGNLAFAKLQNDINLNILRYWELTLGTTDGYNTILVKGYDLVVDGDLPFTTGDINLIGIRGHTVFVEANDEGITAGDWVNVNTSLGTFFCRVEVDSGASEIQIKECLFEVVVQPEIFLPL